MIQGKFLVNMTGWTKEAKLNRIKHVHIFEHSLISVSSLWDASRTVNFSKKNCVIKKNGSVIAICKRKGGMYLVELRSAGERH